MQEEEEEIIKEPENSIEKILISILSYKLQCLK